MAFATRSSALNPNTSSISSSSSGSNCSSSSTSSRIYIANTSTSNCSSMPPPNERNHDSPSTNPIPTQRIRNDYPYFGREGMDLPRGRTVLTISELDGESPQKTRLLSLHNCFV